MDLPVQERRSAREERAFRQDAATRSIRISRLLEIDALLPERYRDHALTGNFRDHRDCHVHPDLILIYRKPDPETLELVRLGSHSELEL